MKFKLPLTSQKIITEVWKCLFCNLTTFSSSLALKLVLFLQIKIFLIYIENVSCIVQSLSLIFQMQLEAILLFHTAIYFHLSVVRSLAVMWAGEVGLPGDQTGFLLPWILVSRAADTTERAIGLSSIHSFLQQKNMRFAVRGGSVHWGADISRWLVLD